MKNKHCVLVEAFQLAFTCPLAAIVANVVTCFKLVNPMARQNNNDLTVKDVINMLGGAQAGRLGGIGERAAGSALNIDTGTVGINSGRRCS